MITICVAKKFVDDDDDDDDDDDENAWTKSNVPNVHVWP